MIKVDLKPETPSQPRLKVGTYWRVIGCLGAALLIAGFLPAQTEQTTSREIISEDFIRNRPRAQKKLPPRKRVYRLADSTSPSAGNEPGTKSSVNRPASTTGLVEQLGVTIWRLRPAKPADTGARMLVQEGSGSSEWVAERIESDTPIKVGDLVRITIESPRAGYLYVIDRELYDDRTKGEAMLIFPTQTTRGGDNSVQAGILIDIPGQEDRPFRATKSRLDHIGELLTIIVTSTPLDLPITMKPLAIASADVARWEATWGSPTERFEMVGGAGQTWTEREKQAAASTGSRQLTQDEPTPQTIYRLTPKGNNSILVNVRLIYGN